MPKASLYVPISVVALLVGAFGACGRSGLDAPAGPASGVAGSGASGGGGAAGFATGGFATGGLATGGFATGGFATGGFAGFVTGGFGGFSDLAGAGGFAIGGAGGGSLGGAGGGCVDGTNNCSDAFTAQICVDGVFASFTCSFGCINGVCAECTPNTSTCTSDTEMQACSAAGVLQPPQPCPVACVDGACANTTCTEGTTRCTPAGTQQTCKGGQWSLEEVCPFVCTGEACGMVPRHVFVSSKSFVGGDLGGLTGADDACRTLAIAAGLSSSYAAWLSTSTSSPSTRFPRDVGPYVLVDGTIIADNWAGLTSGSLQNPIDLTETGGPPPNEGLGCNGSVWTDTSDSGDLVLIGATCGDWTDENGALSVQGSTELVTSWSDLCQGMGVGACMEAWPIFCFEQ
ncbi:MAG TPA: hypothetical protein VHL80_01490 [Polyangia bacterium]|nr:hypothetical protein [Polyangia bacterium]